MASSPPRSRTPPPSPYINADDDDGPTPPSPTSPSGSPFAYTPSPAYYYPPSPVYYPASPDYYPPTSPGGVRWLLPSFSPDSTLDAPRTPSPTSPGYDDTPSPVSFFRRSSPAVYSPSSPGGAPTSPCYCPGRYCGRERERTPQPPASPEYCYGCSTPLEDCCCQEAGTGTAAAEHATPSPPRSPAF